MTRISALLLLFAGVFISSGCTEGLKAESVPRVSMPEQRFDELLARYPDLTFQQLLAETPNRDYVGRLSFDPATVEYYEEAVERLQLTDTEQEILRRQGFVSVDHDQRYSFGSLYYAVYTRDLPVLVTTDSILHAMHRTYDDILMEMEQTYLTSALDQMLITCHDELANLAPRFGATASNYRDVDLYLTVARNLLKGAGAPGGGRIHPGLDAWDGSALINSKLGQDDEAKEILKSIQSLALQRNRPDEITYIYGGARPIDYSQFQPRGHYSKTAALKRYFRTMMWLGRAER